MSVNMTPPTSSVTVSTWDFLLHRSWPSWLHSLTSSHEIRIYNKFQNGLFSHTYYRSYPVLGRCHLSLCGPTGRTDNTTFRIFLSRRFSWMSWNDFMNHVWPRSPDCTFIWHICTSTASWALVVSCSIFSVTIPVFSRNFFRNAWFAHLSISWSRMASSTSVKSPLGALWRSLARNWSTVSAGCCCNCRKRWHSSAHLLPV